MTYKVPDHAFLIRFPGLQLRERQTTFAELVTFEIHYLVLKLKKNIRGHHGGCKEDAHV